MTLELTPDQAKARDALAEYYESVRVGQGKNGAVVLAGGHWLDEETFIVSCVQVVSPVGGDVR